MSERQPIRIHVVPQNPVQYLACCGIVEITSRFDIAATSQWVVLPQPEFIVETLLAEDSLVSCLVRTFTDWKNWTLVEMDDAQVTRLDITFNLNGERRTLTLDWWYETLNPEGEIKKSAWKMYAGNQKCDDLSQKMVQAAKETTISRPPKKLSELIELYQGMTGRFGFDPRSSRNALDAGFSANDLDLPVSTYPIAEMLAMIGVQHFFPHRTREASGNESTRGWIARNVFQYGLWTILLPISLARVAASCAAFEGESMLLAMQSLRASRDKYSNLTMASPTTLRRQTQ